MSSVQLVIPARLASSRLPEKLLRRAGGKSVLQHTFEAASKSKFASSGVLIAVDDDRLAAEADSFGARWIMTPRDCPSGTDRIAEVANHLTHADIFVNVQGDEPEIAPLSIDAVAEALVASPEADIATAGTPILRTSELEDSGIVKIVMAPFDGPSGAGQGRAVYFSRAAVPFDRDGRASEHLHDEPPIYWHHLGLYAYRREFLQWFAQAPPSPLERIERLEQLRAIEAGKRIIVARVGAAAPGIDTESDLKAFRERIEKVD